MEDQADGARLLDVLAALACGATDESPDLDRTLERLTEVTADALHAERASVWVLEGEPPVFRCVELWERTPRRHSQGLCRMASEEPGGIRELRRRRTVAAASVLDAGVWVGGKLVGVVRSEHGGGARAWSVDEHAFSASIADQVALAVEGERRAKAEAQLRQAQRVESIGALAAGIAHDFNNLLTPILAITELALDHAQPPPDLRENLQDIQSCGRRAKSLVEQLLAFGRQQMLDLRPIDLDEEVAGAARILARLLPETIRFRLRLGAAGGRVLADANQLQQVLVNLAINARDAMPAGGELTVRTWPTPDARLVLEVADTGRGIRPEHLPHVFEPFFTTKEPGGGSGLGLAVVDGIVRQHEGTIEIDSQPERGTVVRVSLPCATDPASVPSVPPVRLVPGGGTVLLAEDDALVRKVTRRALELGGYRVLVAGSGEEALALATATAEPIDLLLTDMIMPGIGGAELHLRLLESHPETAVLYMSGHSPAFLPSGEAPMDPRSLLRKPFSPAELCDRVETAICRATREVTRAAGA